MKSKELFEAIGYVDDRYLSMVDTLEKETFEMEFKNKKPIRRKSLAILIAAVICISVLTTTALAAGWIPGIFNAMKTESPEDAVLYNAAAQANTDAVAEVRDIPQLDFTKFTLFERYYDGETILLGYDLNSVVPKPMVGYVPENGDWTKMINGNSVDVLSSEAIIERQNHPFSESTLSQSLSDSCKNMDLILQGMLSPEEYIKAMDFLAKEGRVCVMTHEIWVGDHILVNGHEIAEVLSDEVWNMRYDYEVEQGSCIKLTPLPQAGINQKEVTVTLNIRSCERYYYMDQEGNATTSTGNHKTDTIDFVLENVNK